MIKSFLEDFGKKFVLPNIQQEALLAIPEGMQEFVAEILGSKMSKVVCILPLEGTDIPKYVEIKIDIKWDISSLVDLGYSVVERVWESGEISVLGESIVIWPFSSKYLYRVVLWGDTVESIEVLEPSSRKALESVKSIRIFTKSEGSFFANESGKDIFLLRSTPNIFESSGVVDLGLSGLPNLDLSSKAGKNILDNYKKRGFQIWYVSKDVLRYDDSLGIDVIYEASNSVESSLKRGFVYTEGKILVLTDLEVLGEIDLREYEKGKKIDPSSLDILKKISLGDFVVHEDHGIGKFVGTTVREDNTYIEIAYAGNDRLFVPLWASSKVMKYIGSGKYQPRLTGLNSGLWKRISSKAKEDVDSIAKELLQMYAVREITKAPVILKDDEQVDEYWEFSNEFEFTDTEDQYIATKHIADDFKKSKPMDRLLVGDVGFGKTEIAMRAAFAVVNSGMQVAILAPTTVLTNQHLRVLRERFKGYPFRVEALSRFQSDQEKGVILKDLEEGKIDVIVGTHALLSDSVKFKNLGLLIVDEEQKFGVAQKEKLKSSRVNTHVLSMTATPIPRTLNMSLLGVRDISVLAIAPSGRVEILNEFSPFSFDIVQRCIVRERKRGGQVYYLHNSIESIRFVEEEIKRRIPSVKIEVAHGRLSGDRLIRVMDRFQSGEIEVLLCTTIIENGLDISNANTLIVDDVNRLGLSQMYQIRGRVGRGQRQAYACFFYKSLRGNSALRLEAIKESQALGSGFLLSNRDLEIRGAGDILGKKQSGTINSIGYGLYTQLLSEAVERLKDSK